LLTYYAIESSEPAFLKYIENKSPTTVKMSSTVFVYYLRDGTRKPVLWNPVLPSIMPAPKCLSPDGVVHDPAPWTMMFNAKASGSKALMALDTGCQGDGVASEEWVSLNGIKTYKKETLMVLGDGKSGGLCSKACKVFLTFGGYTSKVESELIVSSLPASVDILVGDAWLKRNRVQLHYDRDIMVIVTASRKHNIQTLAAIDRAKAWSRTPTVPDTRI
jgi:hypothetical protein